MSAESILLRVKVGKDGMEYFDAGPSISEYRVCGTGVEDDWILMRQKIMELMAVRPRMGMEHIMEIVIEVLAEALDEADDNRRPPASKGYGYALMAAEVNQKSKSDLNISSKQMKEQFKTYKAKYTKAKKLSDSTGFGVSIITISQKLNIICPCFEQMDVVFGSQPNITPPSVSDTCKNCIETVTMVDEHIDDNLPNLGESQFDNAGYSKDNPFEEREDGIEYIQYHSDTNHQEFSITSNLSSNLPPESTPTNNTLGKQKASNSLN
ncbi:hypothetical protein BY996DRAFT_6510867 [Phakopsora pachyrhizi]|nr:hypothetical protein BY996DRAFT_6510867 [Phakopsora pachyrhizi]